MSADTPRLLTLTGVGGVGKTHLALAAAAETRHRDGAWLVDLTQYQDPDLVPKAIAAALGHHDPQNTVLDSLALYLSAKDVLLVMDNCEHLINAVADTVAVLLDAAPGLRVLVTSRTPLRIDGERVLDVPPLDVPSPAMEQDVAAVGATVAAMVPLDSVRLLVSRAEAAGAADFGQTADPVLVARLLRQLNGIPLAIVLAASRLRSLDLADILADPSFDLLRRGQRDAHDHHQSLTASIDWSFRLCSQAGRILWTRLAVFTAPCSLHDVTAVCADEPGGTTISGQPIIDLLDDLVQQSVVSQQIEPGQSRYYLLDMMRQYARTQLEEVLGADEAAIWRGRHAAHYLQAARYAGDHRFSPEEAAIVASLRRDMPHYRTALDHLLSTPGGATDALTIVCQLTLATCWFTAATVEEGSRYFKRALDKATTESDHPVPAPVRVMATAQLAWHCVLQQAPDTEHWIERCHQEALAAGDPPNNEVAKPIAYYWFVQGVFLQWVTRDPAAIAILSDALAEFRGRSRVMTHLTSLYAAEAGVRLGDLVVADTASAECLANAERHGTVHAASWAGWIRGWVDITLGDLAPARDRFRRALRGHRDMGSYWGLDWLVDTLAWTAALDGQLTHAAQLLGAASKLHTVTGNDGAGLRSWADTDPRTEADRLVRAVLLPAAYTEAFDAGAALTYEDAIALALDEHPAPVNGPTTTVTDDPQRAGHTMTHAGLTPRELEVAHLVAQDRKNGEIAAELHIARRTVETHIAAIFRKLGVDSRLGVARWIEGTTSTPRSGAPT